MMFVVLSFAVWRVTSLLMYEGMFDGVRARLGIKRDKETCVNSYPENLIGAAFSCFWCLSLIVSVLFVPFARLGIVDSVLLWPAISAGAIILERYFFARYRE